MVTHTIAALIHLQAIETYITVQKFINLVLFRFKNQITLTKCTKYH